MAVKPAVPNTSQGRHLVKTGAFASLEGEARIDTDRDGDDVSGERMILWWCVAISHNEFVVRVERWRVTSVAAFPYEDCSSRVNSRVIQVGIRRGIERIY